MDTYSFLRELADSWVLVAMMVFYVIACLWAFRPGARAANDEAATIPFRNDGTPDVQSQEVEPK
ncbi:cbb3-type cytochrome c oxidase subunit 3 [uncultured Tateyamaria sp.]|uniref:cbb3-type cytochrome c oxidase subunit 3 n=1 Tax=uncultured Tateyamaria sp. TaxID=455651 RepID=UPI002626BAE2|nr:cbb3-type cytochrome c oxidase subunit 3 [uncultured Tateyamaria sp.]